MAPDADRQLEVLLARLDERTAAMMADLAEVRSRMVTQAEFRPVRMVVYGLIALITTTVLAALLSLIINPR